MADKRFEVKITTPADLSGVQATQAALTGILQQTEQVSASAGAATAGIASAAETTGRFADAAGRLREANGRFVDMGKSAKEAGEHIGEASHETEHLISSLKTGLGIDLSHRLIEGLAEIPAKFREMIAEGVRYDQQVESLTLNLAGAFRAASPEKYLNFAAAQAEGGRALDLLREKANTLGLDMHALGESLSINLAALTHAGVNDLEKQISLITLLQQVTAAKGISGFQATRDIIDLLNGQANRTILGKELEPLGVNNETIKAAKDQGQLYEFLAEKFSAYTEAAGAYANTLAAAQQRMKNETEQLYGEISRPVFEALKEAYAALADEVKKPEVRDGLRAIGYDVATIVSTGAGLLNWAVQNAGTLTTLGEALGVAALAWAAFKAASAVSLIAGRTAEWVAETLAVGENTVALEANAAARATVNAASAVSAVETGAAGVVTAEAATATGATIAKGFAAAIQITEAAVIGVAIGTAIGNHIVNAKEAALTSMGERSLARTDQLERLQGKIGSAESDDEKAKRRKELQDLIQQGEKDLAAKKVELGRGIEAFAAPGQVEARKAEIDSLEQYLVQARHVEKTFDQFAGKHPHANSEINKSEAALDEYHKSPEYLLEQAELNGDPQEIANRQYDAAVAKRKHKLMSGEKPLSEDDAEREAQKAETQADQQKDRKKSDADLARIDSQIGKQRDAASLGRDLDDKLGDITPLLPKGTKIDDQSLRAAVGDMPRTSDDPEEQEKLNQEYQKAVELLGKIVTLRKEYAAADKREKDQDEKANKETSRQVAAQRDQADELAITRAKVAGNDSLARLLEYQLKLRHELKKLEDEHAPDAILDATRERLRMEYDIADQKARQKQSDDATAKAAKDREFYEERHPFARREGEDGNAYTKRTGRIDGRPVDTDAAGGLHGGLTNRDFAGLSDIFAGDRNNGADFVTRNAPTATQGVAPAFAVSPTANVAGNSSAASNGENGPASAFSGAAASATKAGGALESSSSRVQQSAQALGRELDTLTGRLKGLEGFGQKLTELTTQVNNLANTVNGLVAG